MMQFCNTPLSFGRNAGDSTLVMDRPLKDSVSMLDNWIDTVVFTSVRRFKADEDFGFSFWDNEFIALNLDDFNKGIDYSAGSEETGRVHMSNAAIRDCERSIRESVRYYLPFLRDMEVDVTLSYERNDRRLINKKRQIGESKYVVKVKVRGHIVFDEFAGTRSRDYSKEVLFLMDPFLKTK